MSSSELGESANAIRDRVGPDARYSGFTPPPVHGGAPAPARRWLGRVLWTTSLVLLIIVLVLALLVALGL
jgi:hypothetical protein